VGRVRHRRNCGVSSQPAIDQAFPPEAARRALTAYNLVSFEGAYSIQWDIGLVIDQFQSLGWAIQASFRGAFAILAIGGAPGPRMVRRDQRFHQTEPRALDALNCR